MNTGRRRRLTPNQIATTCDACGTELYYYPSQFNASARHFCDRLCLGAWRSTQTDVKAANWQGGETSDRGRAQIHMPWHPRAQADGYVYRYISVAELTLRRPLTADEVVHHRDDDETNDHPSNLEVYESQAEHARHHGKIRGTAHMRKGRDDGGRATGI